MPGVLNQFGIAGQKICLLYRPRAKMLKVYGKEFRQSKFSEIFERKLNMNPEFKDNILLKFNNLYKLVNNFRFK